MISEEQLQNFEGMAKELLHDGSLLKPVVDMLIAEVRRLAKLSSEYFAQAEQYDSEADLLAKELSAIYGCWNEDKVYCIERELSDDKQICIKCWRKHICEAARKATEQK